LINEGAPMTYPISVLDGISPEEVKLLKSLRIKTTEKLLDAACTARRRKALKEKTGISARRWLAFATNADRLRVKGIGHDSSKLLDEAGVATVQALKFRNPEHLAQHIRALNDRRKLMRQPPTEQAVKRWIEAAKKLDQKVKH
jgi:hypothetical protein